MRYVISDVHGELRLFLRLLKKIKFSQEDKMYICGDILDKGENPVRLAKYISSFDNIYPIIGNHELSFLKFYRSLIKECGGKNDIAMKKIQKYFGEEGELVDWELVEWLDRLPEYIEEDKFICVHAGLPLDENGKILPLSDARVESLVYDRRFKEPELRHESEKCVFFGHTQTDVICSEAKILGYRKNPMKPASDISDFYKIHLDTGSWSLGVLGCFCIDTLKTVYVRKDRQKK